MKYLMKLKSFTESKTHIKTFEDINKIDKRMGIYVNIEYIIYVINFLNSRDIRFMLLFGRDNEFSENYECFLILIEGSDYTKLDYETRGFSPFTTPVKDYYMEINDDNVFLNWFEPEKIEGDWEIINQDKENVETLIDTKKYNL